MKNNKKIILCEEEAIELITNIKSINVNVGELINEIGGKDDLNYIDLDYIRLRNFRKTINILKNNLDRLID